MSWLEETHGTKFELVRHFLARMFDSEMFSARGQWLRPAVSAFAMALPAGMLLLDPPYLPHGFAIPPPETLRAGAIADELGLLTFLFAITGVVALLAWQSLFPSRRDYLATAGLPVRSRQIFAARFASMAVFALVLVAAMNVLPSLMAPHQFTSHGQTGASALTTIAARAAASTLGCLFIFFSIVAIQGVLLNALPGRMFARISTYVQGALVAVLFLAGLLSWSMVDWDAKTIAALPGFGAWAPPVWFAGVHQAILGDRDPFFAAMAKRGLLAMAAAAGLAALTYVAAYSRYRKLLLEGSEAAPRRRERKWSLIRLVARDPRREAVMQFMATVLSRSRTHRLVVMAYLGAWLAIMVNASLLSGATRRWAAGGWRGALDFAVLVWPLGGSFVMLAGIRHAFSMPAEWASNWIFRITESQGRREWMSAVERFAIAFVIAPIHLISLPAAVALLGWPTAARTTIFQLVVALAAFDVLFNSWQQLPFTCTYVPGKTSLLVAAGFWLESLGVLLPLLSVMIAAASRITGIFVVYLAIFLALWIWLRRRRREGWGEARLLYEDLGEALLDLGIKDMAYRGPDAAPDAAPPGAGPPSGGRGSGEDLHLVGQAFSPAQPIISRPLTSGLQSPRAFQWMETLLQDFRNGVRQLRRNPGFSTVAALILALGIGAVASVYSMCYAVLWRPVVLPRADSLVMVLEALPGNSHFWMPASPADIADINSAVTTLDGLASWAYGMGNLVESGGEPARVELVRVTPNFFQVLGVAPALGRGFVPGEDQPGRDREVVLSDRCWRRRFAADPGILGQPVKLDDRNYTVVGVVPPSFAFPRVSKARNAPMLDSVGRLMPGSTLREAGAELASIAGRLERAHPDTNARRRFVAWPVRRFWTGDYNDRYSGLLLGAAIFVLLICCANVANLQFARSARRAREAAVRAALGAGRARIVQQLVAESLALSACGAAAGLLAAKWALAVIKYGVPVEMRQAMPGWQDIGLGPRTLAVSAGAAVLTGVLAGLAPAWRCSRPDLAESLKEGGRGTSGGVGRRGFRTALASAQIALAVVLLVGAGLVVRGFRAGLGAGASPEPASLLTFHLAPGEGKYAAPYQLSNFYRDALERVTAIPGIRSAAAATALPYSRRSVVRPVVVEGGQVQPGAPLSAQIQAVSANYFEVMRIPLAQGRLPGSGDGPDAPRVAAASVSLARRLWPREPAIGKRIRLESPEGPWTTVAGVVGDIESSALFRTPQPTLYVPFAQSPEGEMDIAVRAEGDPMRLAPDVRAALRSIDPGQPLLNLNTLETLIRQESFGFAYIGALMGVFGLLSKKCN